MIRTKQQEDQDLQLYHQALLESEQTMAENTTQRDSSMNDYGFTPLLIEVKRIFPRFPKVAIALTLTIGLPILLLGTEIIISYTFSPVLWHYPTLLFAALTSPILVLISLKFAWRERYAARFVTSIFLFFTTIIFTQVNSELAANPTNQFDVQIFYRLFVYSIVFLALICISCYAFPRMPEQALQSENGCTNSDSVNDYSG